MIFLSALPLAAQDFPYEEWREVRHGDEIAGLWKGSMKLPISDSITKGAFDADILLTLILKYDKETPLLSLTVTLDCESFLDALLASMRAATQNADPTASAAMLDKDVLWALITGSAGGNFSDDEDTLEIGDYFVTYGTTETVTGGIYADSMFINADRTLLKINLGDIVEDDFSSAEADELILERQFSEAML
jgi:hypothetical protein